MDGGNVSASAMLPTVADLNWTIAAVGDFSGDGKSDFFWRNTATGDNSMWPDGRNGDRLVRGCHERARRDLADRPRSRLSGRWENRSDVAQCIQRLEFHVADERSGCCVLGRTAPRPRYELARRAADRTTVEAPSERETNKVRGTRGSVLFFSSRVYSAGIPS